MPLVGGFGYFELVLYGMKELAKQHYVISPNQSIVSLRSRSRPIKPKRKGKQVFLQLQGCSPETSQKPTPLRPCQINNDDSIVQSILSAYKTE